jgi:hypothetical protein
MKRFKFTMEKVLNYRQKCEDREKRVLEELQVHKRELVLNREKLEEDLTAAPGLPFEMRKRRACL